MIPLCQLESQECLLSYFEQLQVCYLHGFCLSICLHSLTSDVVSFTFSFCYVSFVVKLGLSKYCFSWAIQVLIVMDCNASFSSFNFLDINCLLSDLGFFLFKVLLQGLPVTPVLMLSKQM